MSRPEYREFRTDSYPFKASEGKLKKAEEGNLSARKLAKLVLEGEGNLGKELGEGAKAIKSLDLYKAVLIKSGQIAHREAQFYPFINRIKHAFQRVKNFILAKGQFKSDKALLESVELKMRKGFVAMQEGAEGASLDRIRELAQFRSVEVSQEMIWTAPKVTTKESQFPSPPSGRTLSYASDEAGSAALIELEGPVTLNAIDLYPAAHSGSAKSMQDLQGQLKKVTGKEIVKGSLAVVKYGECEGVRGVYTYLRGGATPFVVNESGSLRQLGSTGGKANLAGEFPYTCAFHPLLPKDQGVLMLPTEVTEKLNAGTISALWKEAEGDPGRFNAALQKAMEKQSPFSFAFMPTPESFSGDVRRKISVQADVAAPVQKEPKQVSSGKKKGVQFTAETVGEGSIEKPTIFGATTEATYRRAPPESRKDLWKKVGRFNTAMEAEMDMDNRLMAHLEKENARRTPAPFNEAVQGCLHKAMEQKEARFDGVQSKFILSTIDEIVEELVESGEEVTKERVQERMIAILDERNETEDTVDAKDYGKVKESHLHPEDKARLDRDLKDGSWNQGDYQEYRFYIFPEQFMASITQFQLSHDDLISLREMVVRRDVSLYLKNLNKFPF